MCEIGTSLEEQQHLAAQYRSKIFFSEYERQQVFVEPFKIAKYPITNKQFHEFTTSTGYQSPYITVYSDASEDFHPVRVISYRDAYAFCQWYGCRLPTEIEWMKAAGGATGLLYPWGNEWHSSKCNNGEDLTVNKHVIRLRNSGGARTTPVDHFLLGSSYYGVMDMVGNVWEITNSFFLSNLTSTVYDLYEDTTEPQVETYDSWSLDAKEYVVLKGGSVRTNRLAMRCGSRLLKHTARWSGDLVGFRCAAFM